MKGTVNYDGATSEPFEMCSGVKQGCVLELKPLSIYFSLMVSYAAGSSRVREYVYVNTRTDGNLFNFSRSRAKTNVRRLLIRETMLFADDAALTTYTEEDTPTTNEQIRAGYGLTTSIKRQMSWGWTLLNMLVAPCTQVQK